MSPAAKLCGFVLLLAVIFAGAYVAGAHLGPVTTSQFQSGGGSGPVNTGGHVSVVPGGNGRP